MLYRVCSKQISILSIKLTEFILFTYLLRKKVILLKCASTKKNFFLFVSLFALDFKIFSVSDVIGVNQGILLINFINNSAR